MNEQRTIFVRHSFIGFHYWPGASGRRLYLRDNHRHTFNVRLELPVDHDDREVEFHDLIEWLRAECMKLGPVRVVDGVSELGPLSCEMMAERIAQAARDEYARGAVVSVDEDGEAGAVVVLSFP